MLSRELLLTGVVHLFDPLTVSAVLRHVIVYQARVVDHVIVHQARVVDHVEEMSRVVDHV